MKNREEKQKLDATLNELESQLPEKLNKIESLRIVWYGIVKTARDILHGEMNDIQDRFHFYKSKAKMIATIEKAIEHLKN